MNYKRSLRVTRAFRKAFPWDRPWRIAGVEGAVRVRNVGATVGEPGWINVRWMPFGDTGGAECAELPATFGGEEVNYICERTTLLSPAERASEAFRDAYFGFSVGTIEDGDGAEVRLVGLSLSTNCMASHAAKYGCTDGEVAILADWIPVPRRRRKAPPLLFPKSIDGFPVYYRRGAQAVAF